VLALAILSVFLKKVTYLVPCVGLSNSPKINHPFLSTAMKYRRNISVAVDSKTDLRDSVAPELT